MAKEKNKTELPTVMEGELRAHLIKIRDEAGFSVAQMANELCLSEEVIKNLENEAFDLLAEPPYVRGYLRNYAKLGEIDSNILISRYESLRGADASELDYQINASTHITPNSKERISPIWAQVILLAVLVGGISLLFTIPGVKNWLDNTWTSFSSQLKPDASNNPSLLGELPVPVPLPEDAVVTPESSSVTTTKPEPTQTPKEQTEASNTSENTPVVPSEATTTTKDDAVNTTESSTENTAAATNESVTTTTTTTATASTSTDSSVEETIVPTNTSQMIDIKFVFSKDVWMRIRDKDNKTVFEGTNKAATEKNLKLLKPLTFRVGNAQGMTMSIDNKAVDISSYINGSIANFTLE